MVLAVDGRECWLVGADEHVEITHFTLLKLGLLLQGRRAAL